MSATFGRLNFSPLPLRLIARHLPDIPTIEKKNEIQGIDIIYAPVKEI